MIRCLIILLFIFSCNDSKSGGSGFDPSEGSGSTDGTEVEENINLPIHWDADLDGVLDNYNLFENNGSITCIVNNEEGYIVGEGDMLAAFINEEQRGTSIASEAPAQLTDYSYQFLLLVYGDVSNVPINFKYYKFDEDIIFDISTTEEYVINMTKGIVTDPILLEVNE